MNLEEEKIVAKQSTQTITSIITQGDLICVAFRCGHSSLWSPMEGYSAEEYTQKMQEKVNTAMNCPNCWALTCLEIQENEVEGDTQ